MRHARIIRNRRLLLEVAQQTPRRIVHVAEALQRLLVGRDRLGVVAPRGGAAGIDNGAAPPDAVLPADPSDTPR